MVADGLRVRGGAGGLSAQFEHLDVAAARLLSSAAALADAVEGVRLGRSSLDVLTGAAGHPFGAAAMELDLLSVWGELQGAQMQSHDLARVVADVVAGYRATDAGCRSLWSTTLVGVAEALWLPGLGLRGGLAHLLPYADALGGRADGPGAAAPAAPDAGAAGGPVPVCPAGPVPPPASGEMEAAALTAALVRPAPAEGVGPATGVPLSLVLACAGGTGADDDRAAVGPMVQDPPADLEGAALERVIGLAGAVIAGPGAVVGARTGMPAAARWMVARMRQLELSGGTTTTVRQVAVPPEQATAGPPRSTADLVQRVREAGDGGGGAPGRVRVERFVGVDGRRSAVVYLPGTQTWRSATSLNPYDLTSNIEALAEQSTSISDAATKALRDAGVTADEDLLLVGHSEGGIAAAQMVTDPAFTADFHPVGLVAVGSPIGSFDIPASVEVVALEHDDDVVPLLEGAPNPDLPTLTTVVAATPDEHGSHDLTGYQVTAGVVDASDDPSLVTARERLSGFLASGATRSQVSDYAAERVR